MAGTHFKGPVDSKEGFTVDGAPLSGVTPQAAQADSVASTVAALVTDFNALLAKLRDAGVIAE